MNDHALLREYAEAGSQTAFGQLVERHVALVYSAARRRLGDAQLAEDADELRTQMKHLNKIVKE